MVGNTESDMVHFKYVNTNRTNINTYFSVILFIRLWIDTSLQRLQNKFRQIHFHFKLMKLHISLHSMTR